MIPMGFLVPLIYLLIQFAFKPEVVAYYVFYFLLYSGGAALGGAVGRVCHRPMTLIGAFLGLFFIFIILETVNSGPS